MTAYASASVLTRAADDGSRLLLETAGGITPTGAVHHPSFFSGFVARPDVTAAALLAVADVAATSYYDLSLLRASLDPVVTASGDRLRFESFSRCNGVYARFDLLDAGIDSGDVRFGTTNVDINQPLRTALASVDPAELLHLAVGDDQLTFSTPDQTHVERQVDLPDRWIRGFAEVPVIASELEPTADLDKVQTMQFLALLPQGAPGPTLHLVRTARGLQPGTPDRADVRIAGTARLSTARRLMRFVVRTRVYRHPSGASGWVFDLPGGRVTMILTAEPYRGFSGEGGLLRELDRAEDDAVRQVHELLAWQPVIDPDRLALDAGLRVEQVRSAIAALATSGRVGFDSAEAAWFHRELPLDPARQTRDNPRLVRARTIVAQGGVARDRDSWRVTVPDGEHWVRERAGRAECTCQWQARYGSSRGPCSHVLAVEIAGASTG